MNAFIDLHQGVYGVEPICKILQIAPSTYYRHAARQADVRQRSARTQRDQQVCASIQRIWEENFHVYGSRKVWRQLRREGMAVARCTVERLMRRLGLKGVRGKSIKTTVSHRHTASPLDRVHRQFTATRPNALCVADFKYVLTGQGVVYVAFVIDVFARYIVGWNVSRTARTAFVLDALEQALHARKPLDKGLIHRKLNFSTMQKSANLSLNSLGSSDEYTPYYAE